jgi:hypothetical protein
LAAERGNLLLGESAEEVKEFFGVFESAGGWGLEPGKLVHVLFAPDFEFEDGGGEVNAEDFGCVDGGADAV